uniref:Kelch domain-containing protein 10 n=1 Tax=Angiostrongylus cantonensis TaxID=6313 RepID=A0A0K0DKC1_ANGCA
MNVFRFLPGMSDFFKDGREKLESHEPAKEANLMVFRELPLGPLSRGNQPAPRSGHRIFTDDQFLYVVGGFDRTVDEREGRIYKEVWRYSLFTHEWSRMEVRGDFPTALASFALSQTSPYSNHVILFGGTAVPFGMSTSSSVHLISFDDDSNSLLSRALPVEGEKLATYGHNPNMEGRYRLEAVLHEGLIYLFGGGRPDYVTELRTLTVFDTRKKSFVEVDTYPDDLIKSGTSEDGYPKGRRYAGSIPLLRDLFEKPYNDWTFDIGCFFFVSEKRKLRKTALFG